MGEYKKNNVYQNSELIDFVESLEERFNLLDYSKKYSSLVNFSKNENIPFHKWFKYREGFAGELVEKLIIDSGIGKYGIIVDPFAGSGTTSVVAKQLGYNTFSIDVNPISSFITNIKLHEYSDEDIKDIQLEIDIYNKSIPVSLEYCSVELTNTQSVEKYFTKNNFIYIIQIKKYINMIKNKMVRNFFKCALLCIVEDASDRKRDGNGLRRYTSKVSNVKEIYTNKLIEMLNDIKKQPKINKCKGLCILGSAKDLTLHYNEFSDTRDNNKMTIIFSPPYPNSFDYFESYKLELVIGDFAENISDIKKYRKKAIRSFIGVKKQESFNKYINLIKTEIENRIPLKEALTGKIDTRTRKVPNMVMGYFYDMEKVIKECYELLNKGEKVYIVVDQSSYLGVIIPTDLILGYFAESNGFTVKEIIECRKARTSPQQLSKYPYLRNILRESIVVLEK